MTPRPRQATVRLARLHRGDGCPVGSLHAKVCPCRPLRTAALWQFDEHLTEQVNLAWAATLLGRSVPHLVRSIKRQFGLSPYAYVVGRRVDRGRQLLLEGAPPAEVALSLGFYDHAHFTRHFKRHTSTTPAGFARSHARRRS